jgi:hypothetical protein
MTMRPPWHSVKEVVHHNNAECQAGRNFERKDWRQGTGGKPLCKECAELAKQGK